jgi:hypothetical protein
MTFSAVAWAYKDLVTSAKLAQMVENTRAHDHRADGSQGAPTPAATIANLGNQATATATFLDLTYTTEVEDSPGGMVNLATAPGRITITEPGLYVVILSVSFASNATGRRISVIRKNGVELERADYNSGTAAVPHRVPFAVSERFAAGDYVDSQGFQGSGAALNITAARLSAVLLAR